MSETGSFGDSVYERGDAIEDAENLDPVENLTGDDPDETMQTSYVPPDREPYNLRHAPTPAEEAEGPSLDERLSEEVPDVTDQGEDFTDPDPRAGRLVSPDGTAAVDTEKDEIAEDVGPAGYASSAEEAAVHVIGEDRVGDGLVGDE